MATGVKATVQKAIRDRLREHLSSYLDEVKKRRRPTFALTPVVPGANECPVIAIYDDGGSQEDFSGYVMRTLPFRIFVVVYEKDEAAAAESAMEYVDAIRACLEDDYTLGDVVIDTEITGEETTGDAIEATGGVMQAGGLTASVLVGHARGAATLS
jgi:hypothetical protein